MHNTDLKLKSIKTNNKPYPYFILDDAINTDLLNSLNNDIKKYDFLLNEDREKKELSPVFRDNNKRGYLIGLRATTMDGDKEHSAFLEALNKNSTAWNKLEKYFTSEKFLKEVLNVFNNNKYINEYIMKRFKFIKLKPRLRQPNYKRTILDFLFRRDFFLSIRFSRYSDNAGTTIHRDNHSKVMAFLLYLNTDNWKNDDKGGFIIYDNSNAKYLRWPEHNRLTKENENKLIIHKYLEYRKNRLIGFCNSPDAWHQAPPTQLSKDNYRDCFQINLFVCKNMSFSLQKIYSIALIFRDILKKVIGIRLNMYT